MNIYENETTKGWVEEALPRVAELLSEEARSGPPAVACADGGYMNLRWRRGVYETFDDIMEIFFPTHYTIWDSSSAEPDICAKSKLRGIAARLGVYFHDAFGSYCRACGGRCEGCDCESKAAAALIATIESLPGIRAMLMEDISSALSGDPAAKFFDEVLLSYPCVEAVATHRIAHRMYTLDVPIIPRILSERAHSRTGIDIHPGAQIGPKFFIDHGTGVVIGETCRIGGNVKIYQGVTLGATSPFDKDGRPRTGQKRHPDIEDDVIIYANATILGGETVIGKGAVIGGNTWITKSVEAGTHVYNKAE
jgi:serine O-acetyltransferase